MFVFGSKWGTEWEMTIWWHAFDGETAMVTDFSTTQISSVWEKLPMKEDGQDSTKK